MSNLQNASNSSFARKPEFEPKRLIQTLQALAERRNWVEYEHVKKNGVQDQGTQDETRILIPGRIATAVETTNAAKQFSAYCTGRGMQAKVGYAESFVPSRAKADGPKRSCRVWVDAQYGSQLRVTATWVCRNADADKRAYVAEPVVVVAPGLGRIRMSMTEFKQMGKGNAAANQL